MAEIGQRPGRAQIYIATHKNKDGVYVNEAAKEICVSFFMNSNCISTRKKKDRTIVVN